MPQPTKILTSPTGYVKLLPPTSVDDENVSILRSHHLTRQHLRFMPKTFSVEEARQLREERAHEPGIFVFNIHVADVNETRFAGMIGFHHIDDVHRSCEVGIMISPDFYGKAVATESLYTMLQFLFVEREFHRVTFETAVDNSAMIRWLEQVAGARLEAIRKEYWRDADGRYTDVKGYSILEQEWLESIKVRLEKRLRL